MPHLISFTSSAFDPAAEPENPFNPIAGQAVLAWLRGQLVEAGLDVTEPGPEDWGWYVDVTTADGNYLVGATLEGEPDEEGRTAFDWILQIHRMRSMRDKLFGRNKMTEEDPLAARIETIVRGHPDVGDVDIQHSA